MEWVFFYKCNTIWSYKDLFHGAHIVDGLYEVEVHGLMFLDVPMPFINYKDEPTNWY